MSSVNLLPALVRNFVTGYTYEGIRQTMEFADETLGPVFNLYLQPETLILARQLTNDVDEQISAILALLRNAIRHPGNNINVENIMRMAIEEARSENFNSPVSIRRRRREPVASSTRTRRRLDFNEEVPINNFNRTESCFTQELNLSLALNDNSMCTICHELLGNTNVCMIYPCGHAFHCSCIAQWYPARNECPVCRGNIVGNMPVRLPKTNSFGKKKPRLTEITNEIKYLKSI
jgi:hypothetical protein